VAKSFRSISWGRRDTHPSLRGWMTLCSPHGSLYHGAGTVWVSATPSEVDARALPALEICREIHREDAKSAKNAGELNHNPLTIRSMPSLIRATFQLTLLDLLSGLFQRLVPSRSSRLCGGKVLPIDLVGPLLLARRLWHGEGVAVTPYRISISTNFRRISLTTVSDAAKFAVTRLGS
jgi:hypothetical protein